MHDGAKTARRTLAYAMLHPVLKLKLLDVILYINKQTKVKRILCVSLSTYDFFSTLYIISPHDSIKSSLMSTYKNHISKNHKVDRYKGKIKKF